MASNYAHDASRVTVAIDGEKGAFVTKVSGEMAMKGNKTAIANAAGKFGQFTTNMISSGEITIEMGLAHAQKWLDWGNSFIDSVHLRKDIQILYGNSRNEVTSGVDCVDCLMTSFGFSALDGAGKDPAKLTVKLRPTTIAKIGAGGTMEAVTKTGQKNYMTNSFKVAMDPLPTIGVTKFDALTWNMKVQEQRTGAARYAQIIPTIVEVPQLKFTVDCALEDALAKWEDFYEKFAVQGNNGSSAELPGAVTLLGANNEEGNELFTIEWKQAGPFEFKRPDREANADKVATFESTWYAEAFDVRDLGVKDS
jgi:hypothetical protein